MDGLRLQIFLMVFAVVVWVAAVIVVTPFIIDFLMPEWGREGGGAGVGVAGSGVEGYVLEGSTGAPISGARVVASTKSVTVPNRVVAEATADKRGYYFMELPAGDYVVVASAKGYVDNSLEASIKVGEVKRLDFTLNMASVEFYGDWGGVKFELAFIMNTTWKIYDTSDVEVAVTVSDMGGNLQIEFKELTLEIPLTGVEYTMPINVKTNVGGRVFMDKLHLNIVGRFNFTASETSKTYPLNVNLVGLVINNLNIPQQYKSNDTTTINISTGGLLGGVRYSLWKGDLPNTYYILNMFGERAVKVSGKPFMILKYNPVTYEVLDCMFGLSEVVQVGLPTKSGMPGIPEPTLSPDQLINLTAGFYKELNLKGPVVLLVGWGIGYYKSAIVNEVGSQSFHFYTYVGKRYLELWRFNYGYVGMTGDVKNLDNVYYEGRDSDTWAFKLLFVMDKVNP